MKTLFLAAVAACAITTAASATITVDGALGSDYGAATASVSYDPTAPSSNFGAPTNSSAYIDYSIYLKASDGQVFGLIKPGSNGTSAGNFANLYFDTDPAAANGSDIGFELSVANQNFFIAGVGSPGAVNDISVAYGVDGLEFSIPNHYFISPVSGFSYAGFSLSSVGSPVTLRLSQSLGFSVAGGATYGPDRLGSVTLAPAAAGAVPEPASWAMMVGGFGLLGGAMRRRRAVAHA